MCYYRVFEKAVHKLSRSFMYLAAAALFVMVLLTTCDVVGRYILNSPIKGTQDMIEFGLVLIGFSGLGYLTSERHHMRADMLNSMLTPRGNAILGAACFLLSLPFAVMLAWQTCVEGIKVASGNYVSPTISVHLGPFYLFAGFGLVLLCVEIVLDIVRYIEEASGRHFADGDEKGLGL
jgi:TRAP-type transport system small permease protein